MTQHHIKMPQRWFGLIAIVVTLDQSTKILAQLYLDRRFPTQILPFFDLVLAYNNGAAFSFLHNAGGWQRYFLIAITIMVTSILIRWLWKLEPKQVTLGVGLALIISGAIGNLIDRILTGQVVDFLSFYYANWRFPAFNVADTVISIGVGLLLIDTLLLSAESKG